MLTVVQLMAAMAVVPFFLGMGPKMQVLELCSV